MTASEFLNNILTDIAVDLNDEFLTTFDRKEFFGKAWKKSPHGLNHTGLMRRGLFAQRPLIRGNTITWRSDMPYAKIHNEGGEIVVTAKMKRFFWAMYIKSSGAISKKKDGSSYSGKRTERLTQESQMWKAMALKKVGDKIKIEQRQFIGDHPKVRERMNFIVDLNMKELRDSMINQMRK